MSLLAAIKAGAKTAPQFDPLAAIPWAHAGWADDPLWTSGKGTDGLNLSGVSNSYAWAPDSNALDISGDITITAKVTADDWTPSATSAFVAKWISNTSQRSFNFQVYTNGALRFNYSTDGSSGSPIDSTAPTGFSDGSTHWVAVTVDVDNGAGGWDVRFWTSPDGAAWTQLGSTVTTATPITLFNSTAPLQIGAMGQSVAGDANALRGVIERATVYSGLRDLNAATGGTLVFDADFTGKALQTSFTESSPNAATVTVGSQARLGRVVTTWRNASGGGDPTQATPANRPIMDYDGLGGRGAVTFDGGDLLTTSVTTIPQPFTVVAIAAATSSGSQRLIATGTPLLGKSSGNIALMGAGDLLISGVTVDSTPRLWAASYAGVSSSLLLNGSTVASGTVGTASATAISLGVAGSGGWVGPVAFWAIYPGDINSDPAFAAFKQWVTTYYGITTS